MEIPKWLRHQLNEAGLEKVREAVFAAEKSTTGEIVPMIVHRSAHKGHVFWLSFFANFALLALAIQVCALGVVHADVLIGLEIANIVVSFILAKIAVGSDWIQRLCTTREDLEAAALLRAQLEFYELDLKKTKGRTGVLLFVSLVEHQAVVLADEGIASQCPPETWQNVIDIMLGGVKRKDFAGGMSDAIAACGKILAEKFPRSANDLDELPNRLIIEE